MATILSITVLIGANLLLHSSMVIKYERRRSPRKEQSDA
jgi:hypothetical protein